MMKISKLTYILLGLLILSILPSILVNSKATGIFSSIEIFNIKIFNVLTLLILTLIADYIVIRYLNSGKYFLKSDNTFLNGYLSNLLIIILGFVFIFIIRYLFVAANLHFDISTMFNISFYELTWFFLFLNIFLFYILVSVTIYSLSTLKEIPYIYKLVFTILNITIGLILYFQFVNNPSIISLVLSFLIFIMVLDIYIDRQSMNSTWIFTWMIVIAGFTSLIIFSVFYDVSSNNLTSEITSKLFERNSEFEKKLSQNRINEKVTSQYIIDQINDDESKFIRRLNTGYIALNNNIFFNPLNGDYIRQNSVPAQNGKMSWMAIYNKNSGGRLEKIINTGNYIISYGDKIIFNNSIFDNIPNLDQQTNNDSLYQFDYKSYNFISYLNKDGFRIIKTEKIPNFFRPLSLFSLLFTIVGFYIFIISILNSRFKFLPQIIDLSFEGIGKLRNRIQLSIIGLLIMSFVSIGILAFLYINNSARKSKNELALNQISNFKNEIYSNPKYDNKTILKNYLLELQKDKDMYYYLYDSKGNLQTDSRRLTDKTNQFPLRVIDFNKVSGINSNNKSWSKGNLNILMKDFKVKKSTEYNIAGYYVTNGNFNNIESNILSNFLNIYVVLFLLAGVVAIGLSNSIAKPIEILGNKLKELNINKKNEILEWSANDEIGQLISFYNAAIVKLEETKRIITKIERDNAWREMAKQVAHEIKNPLTPLKLNIQYMESVVKNYPERASEIVTQIAPALIDQINNLDKIATEFSDFAKMPQARNEKINLNEIVKVVHDFFRKRDDLNIKLYVPIDDLYVFADKNHIVSVLNNIIKNAMQAIPIDREGEVMISLFKDGDNALMKITDNGVGIPEEMVEKVFSPNFTTKSSGSGLGLAISSNMLQAFNGKIYFETKVNEGTSFFVEIPLMRLKDVAREKVVKS